MRHPGSPSLHRLRARAGTLLAAVLPCLVLRALIPFGFMPVAGSHGPAMQLCPGAAAMAGMVHGDPQHPSGTAPAGAHNALCAFAASAAPAIAPATAAILTRSSRLSFGGQAPADSLQLPSIVRAQSARAPPSLA
jgi:hypothetical protein